jgi:hypothetical protein
MLGYSLFPKTENWPTSVRIHETLTDGFSKLETNDPKHYSEAPVLWRFFHETFINPKPGSLKIFKKPETGGYVIFWRLKKNPRTKGFIDYTSLYVNQRTAQIFWE